MDVFECIFSRRSVRKYADIQVSWDKIVDVLEAGRSAPSAGNIQNWRFIVVRNKETKRKIAEAALQQYWIETASAIIIVVDVPDRQKQYYGIRGEKLYSVQSCAAAIQNMLLASHAIGISACWIGAFEEEMLKSALKIPDSVRPQAIITLGYADETPFVPPKQDIFTQVFLESYGASIKDLDLVMGYYSTLWQKKIIAGKELVEKHAEKIEKKVSPAILKLHEKIKEKIKEKFKKK